jgi:hypothetical protein
MHRRLLNAIGVAGAAVLLSGQAPSDGARGAGAAKAGPAPKTAWGTSDLQGIWNDIYETPLERPAKYANKEFFTEEERAAIDAQRSGARRWQQRLAPRGSERDVTGAYNAVFFSFKHVGRRTSLITDPPDGRLPAVTSEVQKRAAAIREYQKALLQAADACKAAQEADCAGVTYGPPSPRRAEAPPYYMTGYINRADGPEDRPLEERCLLTDPLPTSAFLRIVQSPDAVSIFYDVGQGQGWQRIIPVNGTPHLPPQVRQWRGDSRGHWEGQTLVVDVTNFSPKTDFHGSRENLHLVERWTRTDANTLEYAATFEDPTTWVKPWTVKLELARQDEHANRIYYEPRCHEGNAGMVGMLVGSREDERAFAAGRGPNPAARCTANCGAGLTEIDRDPLR